MEWVSHLHDMGVLIDPGQEMDMQAVRRRLTEVNERIVVVGMKNQDVFRTRTNPPPPSKYA
jgi:predicted amino acid-binding ACT domain protein